MGALSFQMNIANNIKIQMMPKFKMQTKQGSSKDPQHQCIQERHQEVVPMGGDESSDSDSITREARAAADKQKKLVPAKGWMNTSINTNNKALAAKTKEEHAATTDATQAEQEATKAKRMQGKVATMMKNKGGQTGKCMI